LKIKHQTLLETPTTQIKAAASAEYAAESKMAIAAAHELYLSEARAAADARSDAASKAADLDLALSAAETLQQRLLEMQVRLQDSEARAQQMEQGGQIYTLSRSPPTERCRHEISTSALVGCEFMVYEFCFVFVVRLLHVFINERRALQLLLLINECRPSRTAP
jgi:hypothetical protein